MVNIARQAADCIFDKVGDDFRIFMTNKTTWCHLSGYIDVGDGCWRRNVLVTGYIQLEIAVGKNEQLETCKLYSLKLESFHLRWKVPIEVGKFSMQL